MRTAVIGGGAAAVSLLDSMLRRFGDTGAPHDITLYEGSSRLATGRAYQPDLDSALVNREAGYMSIRSQERDHFLRWLSDEPGYRDTPWASLPVDSFVPRRIYGEYLTAQLARCRAEAERRGWTVRLVEEYATEAKTAAAEVMIRSGERIRHFDRVVLCLGAGGPADPYRLTGVPGFHPDPYPLREVLPRIADDAHVLVLGTGLSAVDVALALLAADHRGPITMISRRGLLPGVRARQRPFELRHLTPDVVRRRADGAGLRLRDFFSLLHTELTAAGVDIRAETVPRPAQDRLREDLARVEANPYQSFAATALHQLREPIWFALPDTDRRLFLRRFHPFAKPLYNPMPAPTAQTLLDAMDAGRLSVRSGVSAVVARPAGGFWLDGGGRRTGVDTVVDATRSGLAVAGDDAVPFLSSLTGSGLAVRNPHGGLRIDTGTNTLVADQRDEVPRLFALGDITSGDLFYAGSMFMINVRADVITRTWAETAPVPG